MSAPIPELTSVSEGITRAQEQQKERWEKLHALTEWEVYTDGSAPIINPGGVIGFASVFVLGDGEAFEVSGGVPARKTEPPTSNNRAEIAGAIAILELIYRTHTQKLPLPKSVEIVCDSQYVVHCAQGKWKKHKNRDLWQRFDQLASVCRAQKVKVTYRWTRAHVGTEWNERADVLAKEAAMSMEARPVETNSVSKPEPAAKVDNQAYDDGPDDPHYRLRLFTAMSGKNGADGYYEIRTPNRARQQNLTVEDCITLDEAEYRTLHRALNDMLETLVTAGRDASEFRLEISSSRELMLKQIQGLYGVKSERLIPLHQKARQLVRRFAAVAWVQADKKSLKELTTV